MKLFRFDNFAMYLFVTQYFLGAHTECPHGTLRDVVRKCLNFETDRDSENIVYRR